MGLENLPDLTKEYQPVFQKDGWVAVAESIAKQHLPAVEIAEFGLDGQFEVGYVFGLMLFKFPSRTETRVIYSNGTCLDSENIFSSGYSLEDEGFEYHVLRRS